MRITNTLLTIFLLAVLGFALGLLLARAAKKGKRRQPEAPPLSEDAVKQLNQLKSQLDSGLISKAEFESKRREIL